MNKSELINQVTETTELAKKDVTKAVEAVFEVISATLASKEPVNLSGFGNFTVKDRAARTARNIKTGEPIEVPAKSVPAWKPAKALKDQFN
jgi:DNA-binding protein HU-beta